MDLLNLVFPKRCVQCKRPGDYLCPNCFSYLSFDTRSVCLVCQRATIDGSTHPGCRGRYTIDGCFSAIPYNKTAKKLIYNFKYEPFLSSLNKFLGDLLYEQLIQNESFNRVFRGSKTWIFVPIPLHGSKFRKRGYNQSEILAKELGKRFKVKVQNILKRVKNTKSFYGLKVDERKENIKGAFELSSPLTNRNIFLVDDIVTTGSTLSEAANLLKRNGAKKVFALTLARD